MTFRAEPFQGAESNEAITGAHIENGVTGPQLGLVEHLVADEAAGVAPEDLELVELHDCFATAELRHYDNLRRCPEGGAGEWIDRRGPWRDGEIPVNGSGGLLSKGHPSGGDRHREHLRGDHPPARRGRGPADRGGEGRPDPRDRPGQRLRRVHPGEGRRVRGVATAAG
jgi:hypothetical protein